LRKRVKYRERCKIAKTLRCCRFYDLALLPVLVNPIYLGRRHSAIWRTDYLHVTFYMTRKLFLIHIYTSTHVQYLLPYFNWLQCEEWGNASTCIDLHKYLPVCELKCLLIPPFQFLCHYISAGHFLHNMQKTNMRNKFSRTRYNIIWYSLSVTCDRSVVFSGYSGFLHL
jgi:hypothetical protein